MTIFDYVVAPEIAAYVTNSPYNQMAYLGEVVFPSKKQLGLDISWIKGSRGLPVALRPSAFDAKATLRDRIGFSKVETEMPFFREAMRIGEKDRQELNKLAAGNNTAMLEPVLANIFDDIGQLVEGGRVQAERMRMQLLSTGKISVTDNRQVLDYDYGLDANHKETLAGGDTWDNADADILGDIQKWQDTVEEDTGVRPLSGMCSRKTMNYMLKNNAIRNILNPLADATKMHLVDADVKKVLQDRLQLSVAVYTKKFKNESGVATQFFPDDVFTLIPEGTLGSTYFGTTPEESDLMTGALSNAQVAVVNTGIAVTTIKEAHPVNVQTIVSGIFLPSFEQIDNIFIATVK